MAESEQIYVLINFDKDIYNLEKVQEKLMLNSEMLCLSLNALRASTHTHQKKKKVKLRLFSQITMESNLRAEDGSSTYGPTGISEDETGAGERGNSSAILKNRFKHWMEKPE